jgi:hypothetical protein
MFAYEAKILIPSPATQERAVAMLASQQAFNLHWARYNMMAFPFSTTYQNSNQWVLESYAALHSGSIGRENLQSWLKSQQYQPDTINLSAATRLGARMFRANVAFDDHPFGRRMAGQIDTVTVESVLRFIKRREPDSRELILQAKASQGLR